MAGRKLENASYLANDWQDETESKNLLQKGFYNIELTNMDTTSQPAIAGGSSIDIDGVVYVFDSEEAITGSPSDGIVYITITGAATATAAFTDTALPDWDDDKKGFYGGSGERYVASVFKSSTNWKYKHIISDNNLESDFDINIEISERLSSSWEAGTIRQDSVFFFRRAYYEFESDTTFSIPASTTDQVGGLHIVRYSPSTKSFDLFEPNYTSSVLDDVDAPIWDLNQKCYTDSNGNLFLIAGMTLQSSPQLTLSNLVIFNKKRLFTKDYKIWNQITPDTTRNPGDVYLGGSDVLLIAGSNSSALYTNSAVSVHDQSGVWLA